MSLLTRNRTAGFAIALATFALDRGIKAWVAGPLGLPDLGSIYITNFFNLRWTQNLGVSLGLFSASSSEGRLALLLMTGLIGLGVFVWMLREKAMGELTALALVLGGALGNIYDRFMRGYVIDYADLHFGEWRPFLIFNLADVAISLGVLILLARSLFSREKPASGMQSPSETV